jgi:GTP-binding protein HflX
VLQAIGAGDIPQLLVFNKIDRIEGAEPRHDTPGEGRERVWLSARDDNGLDLLKLALAQQLGLERIVGTVHLGEHSARLRSRLHALGAISGERHDESGWHVDVDMALADVRRLATQAGGHALESLLPVEPQEHW